MPANPRPIKIAFDASPLVTNHKSGVAYYTQALVSALASQYPNDVKLIGHYCNFLGRHKNLNLPQSPNIRYRPTKLLSARMINLLRRLKVWLPFELLTKTKADFHLFPAFIGWPSLFKTPSALVIHDVTYLKFPDLVSNRARYDLKTLVPKNLERAVFVITNSQVSASDLAKFYGLKSEKIIIAHIPPLAINQPPAEKLVSTLKKFNIHQPYILFLGNLEPRKNLAVLLGAYKLLKPELKEKYTLVLAGASGWKDDVIKKQLADSKKTGQVIRTGYVSEAERAALFIKAGLYVAPSIYEGFGMTLLEAMAHNTPVLASDIAIFHEVAGEAAGYFDPYDPRQLTNQMDQVLTDKALAKKLVSQGQTNLQRFSWPATIDTIYKHIREAVIENRH